MRPSKGRTIEKKRVNKANKITKTERSRKHRVANKHRREEIHAIDPDMKVVVMNQKTFDEYGTEIEVMDGKVRAAKLDDEVIKATIDFCNEPADYDDAVVEYQEIIDKYPADGTVLGGITVIEEIKTKNKSALQHLADKFKKRKIEL